MILHCLFTRYFDGFVRQRHSAPLATGPVTTGRSFPADNPGRQIITALQTRSR